MAVGWDSIQQQHCQPARKSPGIARCHGPVGRCACQAWKVKLWPLLLAGALLGNMCYAKGVTLKCHHEKDALVWEALVSLPWQSCYKYK